MIADRWELIGQGLLIDSTRDRRIRGLTRFWRNRNGACKSISSFLNGEHEDMSPGIKKRVIVACEKAPANRKLFPNLLCNEKHSSTSP
jgi:hypothetical protein